MSHDPAAAARPRKDTVVVFQKLAKYQDLDWDNIKQNAFHTISIVSWTLDHT